MADGFRTLGQGIGDLIRRGKEEDQRIAIADEVMQQLRNYPDPSDPERKRPIVDQKTYDRFIAAKNHRADVMEGVLKGVQITAALANQARLPYKIGDKTFNIAPSQAAQLESTSADRIPTQIGKDVINLPPSAAAHARLAQMPSGPTAYQQFQMSEAQRKAFDERIKQAPETKFQQNYKLPPKAVLDPEVLSPGSYEHRDDSGNLVEAGAAGGKWVPLNPKVYRENKYTSNVGGVKQEYYSPHPEGEFLNLGGQRIPFSEVKGIQNRHDTLLKQAQQAIRQGADPKQVAQQWNALGYEPRELLQ